MELKKSPKADLKNKRVLLLEIGLLISLGVVIYAFSYTPKENKIEKVEVEYAPVEVEEAEITRQEEEKPVVPEKVEVKVMSDLLQIVDNDTEVKTDFDFSDFDANTEIIQTVDIVEEVIVDDQPFLKAEKMPSFQGGDLTTFRNWVQSRLKYPTIAAENGISGQVILSFVIERSGELTNIEVLRTPDSSLAQEAIRVLKQSPKWAPGMQRNKPVRIKYTLPVVFKIQN